MTDASAMTECKAMKVKKKLKGRTEKETHKKMSTQITNTKNMNTEDTPQKSGDRVAEALHSPAVTLDPQTMKEALETIAAEGEKLLQMEMSHEVEAKVALILAIARKPIDCRVQEETRA